MKIALTGAAGKLGKMLRPRILNEGFELNSLSRDMGLSRLADREKIFSGDIVNQHGLEDFYSNVDVLIHLAGSSIEGPLSEIIHNNLVGLNAVYENAVRHKIPRIIFASSNHAIGMHDNESQLGLSCEYRPDGFYGLSKMWGEGLARLYFDKCGVESICLRIGSVEEAPFNVRHLSTWLGYEDFWQLIHRSIMVPKIGHQIVWGVSNNTRTYWSNSGAEALGYKPIQNAEVYAAEILKKHIERGEVNYIRQGGSFADAPFPI